MFDKIVDYYIDYYNYLVYKYQNYSDYYYYLNYYQLITIIILFNKCKITKNVLTKIKFK